MQYELFYLVGASKEGELDKIRQDAATIVTSEGGAFEEKQVTEKRKLAYPVKHENYGFYVAQRFNLEAAEKIQEINKKLNLYPGILRSLISRADELPELTSREERQAKAAERKPEIRREKPVEAKKPEAKSVVEQAEQPAPAAPEAKKEEKKDISQEDIDKKLEEILNI